MRKTIETLRLGGRVTRYKGKVVSLAPCILGARLVASSGGAALAECEAAGNVPHVYAGTGLAGEAPDFSLTVDAPVDTRAEAQTGETAYYLPGVAVRALDRASVTLTDCATITASHTGVHLELKQGEEPDGRQLTYRQEADVTSVASDGVSITVGAGTLDATILGDVTAAGTAVTLTAGDPYGDDTTGSVTVVVGDGVQLIAGQPHTGETLGSAFGLLNPEDPEQGLAEIGNGGELTVSITAGLAVSAMTHGSAAQPGWRLRLRARPVASSKSPPGAGFTTLQYPAREKTSTARRFH